MKQATSFQISTGCIVLAVCSGLVGCVSQTKECLVPDDIDVLLLLPTRLGSAESSLAPNVLDPLLAYYGRRRSPGSAISQQAETGLVLSADEIRAIMKRHDLKVFVFNGNLKTSPISIPYHLRMGRPLLVMLTPHADNPRWFLVVGYDERRRLVVVQDGRAGLVALPLDAFVNAWTPNEKLTIVVGEAEQ